MPMLCPFITFWNRKHKPAPQVMRSVIRGDTKSKKSGCSVHLLVCMNGREVAGCWVDGYGGGTGAVHWNCAVKLQSQTKKHQELTIVALAQITISTLSLRLVEMALRTEKSRKERLDKQTATKNNIPVHLQFVKVVDVDHTVCVGCSEPFAILAGRHQMDRLSGAWISNTNKLVRHYRRFHIICWW